MPNHNLKIDFYANYFFWGSCSWFLESYFRLLPNFNSVICGYAGISGQNVIYEQVCGGKTGYIKVVLIDCMKKSLDSETSTFPTNLKQNLTKKSKK